MPRWFLRSTEGILFVWFGLVVFNDISNFVGYLMPNSFYTYMSYISYIWFVIGWLFGFVSYQPL